MKLILVFIGVCTGACPIFSYIFSESFLKLSCIALDLGWILSRKNPQNFIYCLHCPTSWQKNLVNTMYKHTVVISCKRSREPMELSNLGEIKGTESCWHFSSVSKKIISITQNTIASFHLILLLKKLRYVFPGNSKTWKNNFQHMLPL